MPEEQFVDDETPQPEEKKESGLGSIEYTFYAHENAESATGSGETAGKEDATPAQDGGETAKAEKTSPAWGESPLEPTTGGAAARRRAGAVPVRLPVHAFHGTRVAQTLTGIALLAFIAFPIVALGKGATLFFIVVIGLVVAVVSSLQYTGGDDE
jgi:hypothetical protein